MRLLFDENLSPRLVVTLEAAYPDSQHVETVGLKGRPDEELWDYAAHAWLSVGNAGTDRIETLLTTSRDRVRGFLDDSEWSLRVLELAPGDTA